MSAVSATWAGDVVSPFFGFLGAASALVFSCECVEMGERGQHAWRARAPHARRKNVWRVRAAGPERAVVGGAVRAARHTSPARDAPRASPPPLDPSLQTRARPCAPPSRLTSHGMVPLQRREARARRREPAKSPFGAE